MCSSQQTTQSMMHVKSNESPAFSSFATPSSTSSVSNGQIHPMALAEYHQRLQLYDYAQQAALRIRLTQSALASQQPASGVASVFGMSPHPALAEATTPFPHINPFGRFDPRYRYVHEEPKPPHSYIGLIAMAILSNSERKMVLSDIYQYILDNYPYFRNRGPGWRNSIRHNLSLNDCFVKAGRSANGKGHYWAIHPANVDDFRKGDFRRRKAQRKVRKHMGLSVPDDEDSSSPTPTPVPTPLVGSPFPGNRQVISPSDMNIAFRPPHQLMSGHNPISFNDFTTAFTRNARSGIALRPELFENMGHAASGNRVSKRLFDVESLLAPDSTVTEHHAADENKAAGRDEGSDKDGGQRNSSPVSIESVGEYARRVDQTESNCSSPSVSSSSVASPQRESSPLPRVATKEKMNEREQERLTRVHGNIFSPWQMAHIQSLQNLHHINSGLLNSQAMRNEAGLSAWAAMSALSHPSGLLSYSTAIASSLGNAAGDNSEPQANNSTLNVLSAKSGSHQK